MRNAKSWMKSWLAAVFAVGFAVAVAQGKTETETLGGVTWSHSTENGNATVTDANPAEGSLTLPSSLGGYPVTSIGKRAFYNYSGLPSVLIGDSVTNIGESAFRSCSALTSVTIGDSVTSIGDLAFYSCSGLTNVAIPDSVTSIGDHAFAFCSGLTSVTIGDNVTCIGDGAFYVCTNLTSVTIPDSVRTIGADAFRDCSVLTSLTIGNSVTTIGDCAFYVCTNLTSVTVPDSVTSIGAEAFRACSGLTSVMIGNSVTNIGAYAFANCRGLTSVTMPDSVTSIGDAAFRGCTNLTGVIMSGNVMRIGDYAFDRCSRLMNVTIPSSVMHIGGHAFSACSGMTNATIGNGVTDIGAYAFTNCYNLKSLVIPDSVQSIGCCAFEDCKGVVSCTIGKGLESIGEGPGAHGAFANAYTLTAFSVDPENPYFKSENGALCTKDGKELVAFPAGCRGEFAVPSGVEKIWAGAFCGAFELKSLVIPDSVTRIGNGVFSGCSSLADVYIPARFKGNETNFFAVKSTNSCSHCSFHYERPLERTLTLDGQGGIVETVTVRPTYCEAMPNVSVPTREGYWFGGYFSEPNGGGVQYYTAKGESCRTWDSLTVTTLYALWLEKTDVLPEAGDEATVASVLAGAADGRLKERIGSVEEYGAFRAWVSAKGLDAEAVMASPHAWISYVLGADGLFENEPTIQIGGVAIALEVRVIVNDGEREVLVDADKVAGMFEATGDAGDWGGEGRLPAVAMPTGADGAEMRFKVLPGDGTAGAAFLRIAP